MADELPPLVASLIGDASDLYQTLTEVESVLSAFADKEWTAQLGLNTSGAMAALTAFESAADSTHLTIPVTLDLGGAYAQLAALHIATDAAGGGGGGGGTPSAVGVVGGPEAAAIASLLSQSRTTAGSQGIAQLYGIPLPESGGGGGGGGLSGLLTMLGFGANAGRFGTAGFGTIGSLAGFGLESFATTGLGIAGSGLGALAGGGALLAGAAGVGGVGMGTDLAGIGQAAGDIKNTVSAMNALDQAVAVYGPTSSQAVTAQAQLNYALAGFNPVARAAVEQAANTAQGFKAMFDQATGAAESTGAQILTQLMQVGEKFLPTIGQFAAQNMTIIQNSLQPLLTFIQGPGLSIFKELEQEFQDFLPTAMAGFDNAVELVIRILGFLAPYTGKLVDSFAKWMALLNGADFGKLTGGIASAIGVFRDWEGLIKAVGKAIYELFTHDAHTGTAIIVMLTNLVNKFNHWASTVAGGDHLHSLLESHKNEILAVMGTLGHLISTWGQLELAARPVLMDIIGLLAKITNVLMSTPVIGQILGMGVAFYVLYTKIGLVKDLFRPMMKLIGDLAQVLLATLFPALTDATGGMAGLDAAMDANPVGVVILGILAVAAAVYLLYKYWKQVSDFLHGPWGTALSVAIMGLLPMIGIPMLIIGHWQLLVNFFKNTVPSAIMVMVHFFEAIPGEVNHVWSAVTNALHSAWSSVANWVHGNVTGPIAAFFEAIPRTIDHIWGDVVSSMHSAWSSVANWVHGNVTGPIADFYEAIPGTIDHIWGDVVSAMHSAWSSVANWVSSNVTHPVENFFNAIPGTIDHIWGNVTNALHSAWSGLANWVENVVVSPMIQFFLSIPGAIGNIGAGIWNDITGGIGDIAGWINQHIVQPIVNLIRGIPGDIGNVGGGIASDITGGIAGAVAGATGALGGLINLAHHLAGGGYVSQPTFALVGEAGPEYVIPEADLKAFLGAGAISALPSVAPGAITGNTGSFSTTVLNVTNPIQISGQTIAQIVTQYQLRGARATGNIAGQYAGGTQGQTATAINTNAVPR